MDERDLAYRAKFIDDASRAHADMISRMVEGNGRIGAAERAWNDEIKEVRKSIIEQRDALVLRKEALDDPAMQRAIAETRKLQEEIRALTKVEHAENEAVQLTTRSRRELIVLAHELSQGRYKNFGGSLMVLEEGQGGIMGALKAVTAMLGGPYVVAAGAATLATAGIAHAMWAAAESSAEMVHKAELLGKAEGVSTQTMLGFQYMATGTNVSVDQLGRAFARFTANLGEHSAKMREIGITAKDPLQAFEQLMDIIRNTADATERDRIAKEALGKEWMRFLPILEQGSASAKDAIAAMHIPEETLHNFEKANKAQIEIDKTFLAMKLHAGEAASGIRSTFKELELGLLKDINGHSMAELLLKLSLAPLLAVPGIGQVIAGYQVLRAKAIGSAALNEAPGGSQGSEVERYSDEQKDALKWLNGKESKDSLKKQLENIREEYMEKAKAFSERSDEYKQFMRQELKAEEDAKMKWAKDHKEKDPPSARFVEYHDPEQANREAALKRQHAQALADRKSEAAAAANSEKIQLGWVGALTNAQKKQHDEKMAAIQKEGDLVQSLAARELSTTIQGKMTAKQLEQDMTAFLADQFAERVTKWIEQQIIQAAFSESQAATQMAVNEAQAGALAASWSPAAMSASIATFGGATATGEAAYFQALASGQIMAAGMAHARGGAVFGPVNASREEAFMPLVPGRIVPAYNSQTTHNTYGGNTVTVHIHGGDQRTILKTIQNATRDRRQVSRV